jgi:tetratricopeptide (TPR) repeat protein
LAGPVAAYSVIVIILVRRKPDPVRLLQAGRPQEAYRQLERELSFTRELARKRPMFRDMLASNLETMSQVLQVLDSEPQALEAATEAAAIYTELTAKRPRYTDALAGTLLQQAALLAQMGRHGETLAAIEPAVQIYRRLAVDDHSTYLPCLAAALTRQADELGYLDRITEARAAAAEAELIRTDMLPSAQP